MHYTLQVGSDQFGYHLQGTSKPADHYVLEKIKEMEMRNKALEEKVAMLEKKSEKEVDALCGKVEVLKKQVEELSKDNIILKNQVKALEDQNVQLQESMFTASAQEFSSIAPSNNDPVSDEIECFTPQSAEQEHCVDSNTKEYSSDRQYIKQVEDKVLEVEHTLTILINTHLSKLELQLQASLACSTHNGTLLWRISEVQQRIQDAKSDHTTFIDSPPFFTGKNGYQLCVRVFLNGEGAAKGTHLSIFFILMKGEYDSLLQWPFEHKISLILVDHGYIKHLVKTFKPDSQSSSCKRPVSDKNVIVRCPEFAELSALDNSSYVNGDVMYIKAIVDTSNIFHP